MYSISYVTFKKLKSTKTHNISIFWPLPLGNPNKTCVKCGYHLDNYVSVRLWHSPSLEKEVNVHVWFLPPRWLDCVIALPPHQIFPFMLSQLPWLQCNFNRVMYYVNSLRSIFSVISIIILILNKTLLIFIITYITLWLCIKLSNVYVC